MCPEGSPWQGEREPGRFRVIVPLGSRGSFAVVGAPISDQPGSASPDYFRLPATPNRDEVEIWGPAPAQEVLDFGSNPQPTSVFSALYGWPFPALW
jgi:hypothetical protein